MRLRLVVLNELKLSWRHSLLSRNHDLTCTLIGFYPMLVIS